jgi:hypothetical protein
MRQKDFPRRNTVAVRPSISAPVEIPFQPITVLNYDGAWLARMTNPALNIEVFVAFQVETTIDGG